MRRIFGRAIGNVVSPVLEFVDIDGVVRRINVEDIVERIDIDALIERVDINRVIDRIDINRHLDRIDIDRILARSNLDQIIARSSSGIFTGIFVIFRNRMARMDQNLQRCGRLACRRKRLLPPRPSEKVSLSKSEWPDSQRDFGLALQGRYSGSLTRFTAAIMDHLILMTLFTIVALLLSLIRTHIFGDRDDSLPEWFEWIVPLTYVCFTFWYYILSWVIVGRTIGMTMLGLLMVSSNGHRIGLIQAIARAVTEPISVLLCGYILGLIRRDGRQWHDLITGTGIVYSWDARLARLREEDDLINVSVNFGSNDMKTSPDHAWNADMETPPNHGWNGEISGDTKVMETPPEKSK